MGKISEWMLTHSNRYSDEELLEMGYSREDIILFRSECPIEEDKGARLFSGSFFCLFAR